MGAVFGVHHGLANSILLPACLRYNADACEDVYLNVLSAMGDNMEGIQPGKAGEIVADKITEFTKKLGLPRRLRDVSCEDHGRNVQSSPFPTERGQ